MLISRIIKSSTTVFNRSTNQIRLYTINRGEPKDYRTQDTIRLIRRGYSCRVVDIKPPFRSKSKAKIGRHNNLSICANTHYLPKHLMLMFPYYQSCNI